MAAPLSSDAAIVREETNPDVLEAPLPEILAAVSNDTTNLPMLVEALPRILQANADLSSLLQCGNLLHRFFRDTIIRLGTEPQVEFVTSLKAACETAGVEMPPQFLLAEANALYNSGNVGESDAILASVGQTLETLRNQASYQENEAEHLLLNALSGSYANLRSIVLQFKGEWRLSEQVLNRALEEATDPNLQVNFIRKQAEWMTVMGDRKEAIGVAEIAVEKALDMDPADPTLVATTLVRLGMCQARAAMHSEAIETYLDVLARFDHIGGLSSGYYAGVLGNCLVVLLRDIESNTISDDLKAQVADRLRQHVGIEGEVDLAERTSLRDSLGHILERQRGGFKLLWSVNLHRAGDETIADTLLAEHPEVATLDRIQSGLWPCFGVDILDAPQ